MQGTFSLEDTQHEDSSPAAPTGGPLSTAPGGQDRRPANTEPVTVPGPGHDAPAAATASRPATAARPWIAVDAMGGDHAPAEIVAGALAAQREHGV
ncbi:MAG: hypothetical protein ACRDPY_42780, partial [Streptosporangiaceae bacterium]